MTLDLKPEESKALLDYLAEQIVGRMSALPPGTKSLFRIGASQRDSLHILTSNVTYSPYIDYHATATGLMIRICTADGFTVAQWFYAWGE